MYLYKLYILRHGLLVKVTNDVRVTNIFDVLSVRKKCWIKGHALILYSVEVEGNLQFFSVSISRSRSQR